MFVDARSLPADATIEGETGVIGAGAAGITLARELSRDGSGIVVLESGTFEFEPETQKLYHGDVVGRDFVPLDADRLRFFGGTTNHWDGACNPFDPIDFEVRDYVRDSGWTFDHATLDPYYRRAQSVCQLGPYTYEPQDWADPGAAPFDFGAGARIRNVLFQNSPPTRFGTVYRDELAKAAGVTVYLHANVVDIEATENTAEVTGLRVAALGAAQFRVKARRYVLAAGGIENARILLTADRVETGGLGNANGLVGRYFMDHLQVNKTANILFNEAYPNFAFYDFHVVNGIKIYGGFQATAETQRREALPNFHIGLDPGHLADVSTSMASLRTLYKSMRAGRWPSNVGFHLGRIIGDLDGLTAALYHRVRGDQPPLFTTSYSCECPPDPESRVKLTDARDALGQRQVALDWRVPGDVVATMERAHRILGEELGRVGLARLRLNTADTTGDPMEFATHGHHHMGTTRMHDDPKRGVVDADCRVHGKANLYIAGSSVFPTYSHDNPTYTLVALAIRLADHLKSQRS
jgi:choline dehydrogenase-like flavoprotein